MLFGLGCTCLLALGFAAAPRVFLIIAWIANPRWWSIVWSSWLWPLFGIIFLPYTTVMYMLSWNLSDGGVSGWAWMWVFMGFILDLMQWSGVYDRRNEIPSMSNYAG